MNTLWRLGLATSAFCLCTFAAGSLFADDLKVGDKAPAFESTDDQGKTWKSMDHVGKKMLVIYFFPAAMTGG